VPSTERKKEGRTVFPPPGKGLSPGRENRTTLKAANSGLTVKGEKKKGRSCNFREKGGTFVSEEEREGDETRLSIIQHIHEEEEEASYHSLQRGAGGKGRRSISQKKKGGKYRGESFH